MTDNAALAREVYDAWNSRDYDRLAAAMAPDGKTILVPTGQTFDGPDGARQSSMVWAEAFPDGAITVERVVAEGDHVAVEYTGHGTHTGTFTTPMGSIPATGRSVTLQMCDFIEFKDGKVAVQRQYFDTGSLMAQLGVASGQTATT
ncbi:MAG TPA: ester cyclase [Marmoricola sp.]|jgi:steroid delta-isomerase-like uncharacterized protein|nr:ester cyclase [Marmoricola sp.]